MTNYTYLIGVTMFAIIWLALFLYKKNLRKEMLTMSLLVAPAGAFSSFIFIRDYWSPEYIFTFLNTGPEDILFGFFLGGISAIIYEALFIKQQKQTTKEPFTKIAISTTIGIALFLILTFLFKINSIYSSSIALIAIGSTFLIKRKDLIKNAIVSGILITLIVFLFYVIYLAIFPAVIHEWWQLEKLSGILILGIPIEELMWSFALGFLVGPLYEFWKGKKEIIK